MATYTGTRFGNPYPPITTSCQCKASVISSATIPDAGLSDGDIIKLVTIPAGFRIVDLVIFSDDLDAHADTPTVTVSVGLMDSADTSLDTVFITDSDVAQGGGVAEPTATTMYTTAVSTSDKVLAIEVTASAAVAAGGGIGVKVSYIPA